MITARGRQLVARVAALALRDARPRLSRSLYQVGTGTDLTVARRGWGSPFGSSTTRVQRISFRFPSLNADVTPPSEADVAAPVSSAPSEADEAEPVSSAAADVAEPVSSAAADVAEPVSSAAADVADSLPSNVEVVEVESDGIRLNPSGSSTAVAAAATGEMSEQTSEVTSLAAAGLMSSSSATEEATSSAAAIEQVHTTTASSSTTQTIDSTSSAPETSFAQQQRMQETLQDGHLQDQSLSGGAVYARIENSPKYILKSDILRYFEGSGLKSENIALSYDPRYRAKHWYAEFESMKQYNIASGMTVTRKSMWTRPIRLIRVKKERMLLELRAAADLANFRDRSLILINLPEDVKIHDIERLFDGNRIAAHGIKLFTIMHEIVKTPPRLRLQGERRHELHNIMEKRAVVKFESELEALRALREKQGDFVFDREVQLKFLR